MRTIKFRAKEAFKPQSPWIYGGGVHEYKDESDNLHWLMLTEDTEGKPMLIAVDPDSVGESTGLLDGKGKEIYEGDLYKSAWSSSPPKEVKWKEEWDDVECSYAGWSFDVINPSFVKIIGNIYEHPEFLTPQPEW